MEEVPCLHCGTFFIRRNKRQNYCSYPACQRARKAARQRHKKQTDPEYRESQRISNKKWQKANPGYWKQYRKDNPEKASRNKALQRIRNRSHRPPTSTPVKMIAKMDARKPSVAGISGHYWLVPENAKMDVAKIYLHAISEGCP